MGYGVWVGGVNFRERPLVRVRDGGECAGLGRDMYVSECWKFPCPFGGIPHSPCSFP